MARIFISYRRQNAIHQADRIHAAFAREVGRENVFMDVDSIGLGENFRNILRDWVNKCEVLLALIGSDWIDVRDPETGQPRLNSPSDFVRYEIGEALRRNISVVPVLLDGAPLPRADQLPDDLKELCDRQAEFVEFRTFDADVERLIRRLGLSGRPTPAPAPSDGRIEILPAGLANGAPDGWFRPGAGKIEWFKDFDAGPEMVVVPAGRFLMGTPAEVEGFDGEKPQHEVIIAKPFAVGRYAVTFDEWIACAAEGSCGFVPDDWGWGCEKRPVIKVSWNDAQGYVKWLSEKSGKNYRLLSEAEWEYVCRAGTAGPFWWGSSISTGQANYNGHWTYGGGPAGLYREKTLPVNSFNPNPWGLYQMHGNILEWVEDRWHDNYSGAPSDGSAWTSGDNDYRVCRGGSWNYRPDWLRAAYREGRYNGTTKTGLRIARTLSP
jgi:formylglycine-generating enzyme required for sulfatase activity